MSEFLKRFLLEDPRRFAGAGRFGGLGAFGKHPGWDDHIRDLGLESDSLRLAETVLYVNGIGGQIDRGAWEKLDSTHQLAAFKHVFVWQRSRQFLIGRLWSSSDGKGRTRYPMVVCAHFADVPLARALELALPVLAELQAGCQGIVSAEQVRELLGRARAELAERVRTADLTAESTTVSGAMMKERVKEMTGRQPDSLLRVLYQIQNQFSSFALEPPPSRPKTATHRAQQIRVPVSGDKADQALLFWARFLLPPLGKSALLLLMMPVDELWVDVTVNEPESSDFFCLRASAAEAPLASDIPYTLDETFRAKAADFLERITGGDSFEAGVPAGLVAEAQPPGAPRKTWRNWFSAVTLTVTAIVVLAAVLARVDWRSRGKNASKKSNETNRFARFSLAAAARSAAETNSSHPGSAAERARPNSGPPVSGGSVSASRAGEMTNRIGMILVRLPSGIWAGKYEVTQAEYRAVMGTNPSRSVNDRQPVESVTWPEAVEFCRRLTELERSSLSPGNTYALPTNRQWNELLDGQKIEDLPNRELSSHRVLPAPVGLSGATNRLGLFDLLGNVWEWCLDGGDGSQKRMNGGAFDSDLPELMRPPETRASDCGFRCILTGP